MGIGSSQDNLDTFMKDYIIVQRNENNTFLYLQHRQTEEEFLLRLFSFNDCSQCERVMDKLKKMKQKWAGNKYVVNLKDYLLYTEQQYCTTVYQLYALFEYPQRTLDDQIAERKVQKRRFEEKELWSILSSCIIGLSHLQNQNIKHSCLKSSTVLLSKEGNIKVSDPFITGLMTNYNTILTKRSTPHLYLSPELVRSLGEEVVTPTINQYKSDLWTMAMIILEGGLLEYQDGCYNGDKTRINWQYLDGQMMNFAKTYSQSLVKVLQHMLNRDQRVRADWIALERLVTKNQKPPSHQPKTQNLIINKSSHPPSNYSIPTAHSYSPRNNFYNNHPPSNLSLRETPSFGQNFLNRSSSPHHIRFGSLNDLNHHQVGSQRPVNHVQIPPIRPSGIQSIRPQISIFPAKDYQTRTRFDQNLILVPEGIQSNSQAGFNINNSPVTETTIHHQISFNAHKSLDQIGDYQKYSPRPTHDQSRIVTGSNEEQKYVEEMFKLGSRYEGYKLRGMRHGHGKFYYQDGGMYDGYWKENKMDGLGKLYYQTGKLAYDGSWKDDQFSGFGILFNQEPDQLETAFNYEDFDQLDQYWTKYEGYFAEDMKNGRGILYLSNGQKFQGDFIADVIEGQGTFHTVEGKQIHGRWASNQKIE